MGKSNTPDPPNCQKYGVPIYGVAWVPAKIVFDQKLEEKDEVCADGSPPSIESHNYLVLAGGGGEGRSGIPNAVLLSHFDYASNSLSDQPVAKLLTGADLPYRMAVHPSGEGLICSSPKSCRCGKRAAIKISETEKNPNKLFYSCARNICGYFDWWDNQETQRQSTATHNQHDDMGHPQNELRDVIHLWYEWDEVKSAEDHILGLKASEKVLTQLEDVGQQLALAFNDEGSVLAVGGEDGNLRVFKWPSMGIILDDTHAHESVKDLNFSPDGKFLVVSLGSGGPCRVWDVTSSAVVASLAKESDEIFGFCRFSQTTDNNQILYTTMMRDQGGSIVTWDTTKWKRIGSKQVVRDAICAFNVSADGKLLAVGTDRGDILVINSTTMRVQTIVRKAHLGFVTALKFSQESRALASTSMDSSARVTLITEETTNGFSLWVIIFIIVLAIAAYALKTRGFLS